MPSIYRAILFSSEAFERVFPPAVLAQVGRATEISGPPIPGVDFRKFPELLAEADLILGTWGMPRLDREFLALAPKLKAVFYGAGSVKGFVTEESWERGVVIVSAADANNVPVAEYTLSVILLSLKQFWQQARETKTEKHWKRTRAVAGAYGSTIGLVALGSIGKMVAKLLRNFNVRVLVYDPFFPAEEGASLGVTPVPLDQLFRESDVVSLHAPWIKETVGMIDAPLLKSMKPGATLVNTARGAIVNEADLCQTLAERPDLTAILDVTYPEPPVPESPLYTLPNVVLTPHIAGALNAECGRMGQAMADEVDRFVRGEPLRHEVKREMVARMA